jgi:hypothetical protein
VAGFQPCHAGLLEIGAAAFPFIPGAFGRFGDEAVGFVGKYFDEAVDFVNGFCSFTAETLIMTEDGSVPISEVELWENVLAYDEETGEIGYYPVTDVWERIDPIIVTLPLWAGLPLALRQASRLAAVLAFLWVWCGKSPLLGQAHTGTSWLLMQSRTGWATANLSKERMGNG